MKIFIEKTDEKINLKFEGEAKALLKKLKINPEEVIVVKNGELISEEEKLSDSDYVKILSVISGG
jgi:sulfur carrier protein ThiS